MNGYLVGAIAGINGALGLWYCAGLVLLKISRINYFSLWQRRFTMFRPFALVTAGFGAAYLVFALAGIHNSAARLAAAFALSFAASSLFRRVEMSLHI